MKIKLNRKLLIIAACAVCAVIAGVVPGVLAAGSAGPGSPEDPLVTKSYVDAKLAEVKQQTSVSSGLVFPGNLTKDDIIEEIMAQIDYFYGGAASPGVAFTPVFMNAGDVMIGHEGTEIILRSGKAAGYVKVENGISDVTEGTEIYDNAAISINHLLIIPKYDERGIQALTDIWLIVKGGFEVKN